MNNSNSQNYSTSLLPKSHIGLLYSTYFGGSNADGCWKVASDKIGRIFLASGTLSSDFPITNNAHQKNIKGTINDCLTILSGDGKSILYSTYFGDTSRFTVKSLCVDNHNNVYMAGDTRYAGLPTTEKALQKEIRGIYNGYIAKFDSNGVFVYGTYLGGSGYNKLNDIKVDNAGYMYIVGSTDAAFNFPITSNALQKNYGGGEYDIFLSKLKPDGSDFIFSTFFGGENYDEGYSLALDNRSDIFITGLTASYNFPTTVNAYQKYYNNYEDGFVMKINSDGNNIIYSTYIGGRSNDTSELIAVNESGEAFVAGRTNSIDFPVTPGAFRTKKSGDSSLHIDDYYLTKFNSDGSELLYSTFLSPEGITFIPPSSIQLLKSGQIVFTGNTDIVDLPVTSNAFQKKLLGDYDGFIMILDSTLSNMVYCSYIGGSGGKYEMIGSSIASNDGKLIIAGQTESTDFPITSDAIKKSITGLTDIFVSIFDIRDILNGIHDERQAELALILSQNYPNPFSLSTIIKFEVPLPFKRSSLKNGSLKIFDVLGREILDLSNELESSLTKGTFATKLSASQFPKSGIYFYQLTFLDSNGLVQKLTKKMNVLM